MRAALPVLLLVFLWCFVLDLFIVAAWRNVSDVGTAPKHSFKMKRNTWKPSKNDHRYFDKPGKKRSYSYLQRWNFLVNFISFMFLLHLLAETLLFFRFKAEHYGPSNKVLISLISSQAASLYFIWKLTINAESKAGNLGLTSCWLIFKIKKSP